MKTLLLLLALCASFTAQAQQCKAPTKAGPQCSRKAVKTGYCTQHFKMLNKGKEITLPEEINQANVGDTLIVTRSKAGFVVIDNLRPVTRKTVKK